MIKTLLKKAIESNNPFMGEDMIRLQIEFFNTAGKLTDEDKQDLLTMMTPPEPVQPEA